MNEKSKTERLAFGMTEEKFKDMLEKNERYQKNLMTVTLLNNL